MALCIPSLLINDHNKLVALIPELKRHHRTAADFDFSVDHSPKLIDLKVEKVGWEHILPQ